MEHMLMILPLRLAIIPGATRFGNDQWGNKVDIKNLLKITDSHVQDWNSFDDPALFTRISIGPICFSISEIPLSTASSLVTSKLRVKTSKPTLLYSILQASSFSSERSLTQILAPAAPKSWQWPFRSVCSACNQCDLPR